VILEPARSLTPPLHYSFKLTLIIVAVIAEIGAILCEC
jgi:hypothetical protein